MTEQQLIDGSIPASPDDVTQHLTRLGIAHRTISHEPMFTVEDSRRFRNGVPGGYSKNLFLRNKKGRMWLVTLCEDRAVDLKTLGEKIGAGRVSFGSAERLMHHLGVVSGAVTPLAVINDHECVVTAVIDAELLTLDPLHFHPCVNTRTTTLDHQGLVQYMTAFNHKPELLSF